LSVGDSEALTTPSKRVLVADDDAAIRRLVQLTLAEQFEVTLDDENAEYGQQEGRK